MSVVDKLRQRYLAAGHAMQSGVAVKMTVDPKETTPKHLRVGVNAAMRDSASLAYLLIQKGVITEEEYVRALAEGMEAEAKAYQDFLQAHGFPGVGLA